MINNITFPAFAQIFTTDNRMWGYTGPHAEFLARLNEVPEQEETFLRIWWVEAAPGMGHHCHNVRWAVAGLSYGCRSPTIHYVHSPNPS